MMKDRALMQSFGRLCSKRNCFGKAEMDNEILETYEAAMKLAQAAPDNMLTTDVQGVTESLLLVLTNSAICLKNAPEQEKSKAKITVRTFEMDSEAACLLLDGRAQITKKYECLLRGEEWAQRWKENLTTPSRRKLLRVFRRVFLVVVVLAALFALSGLFVPTMIGQPEPGNMLERFMALMNYKVLKRQAPVSLAEKWVVASRLAGWAVLVVVGLSIAGFIIQHFYRRMKRKKAKSIRRNWEDFQQIKAAFETVEKQAKELEW